jgi:hypothetical protein
MDLEVAPIISAHIPLTRTQCHGNNWKMSSSMCIREYQSDPPDCDLERGRTGPEMLQQK